MGINAGANEMGNVLAKSSMVGQASQMRPTARVRETETHHDDARVEGESGEDSVRLGSSRAPVDKPLPRLLGPEARGTQRPQQEAVDWGEQAQAPDLPPSLQPQTRNATSRADYNVPFWLRARTTDGQAPESPLASKHRLLNGLRNMLSNELKQYSKSNTTYPKSTLRALYDVLDTGSGPSAHASRTVLGDPAGYTLRNLTNLERSLGAIYDSPRPHGQELDRVA